MKTLWLAVLAAAALALSFGAQADCDLTWKVTLSAGGVVKAENARVLHDLTPTDLAKQQARGKKALNAVVGGQDKGGPITMLLAESATCDGKAMPAGGELELRGLRMKDANKFLREASKNDALMADEIDAREAAGKKTPWGK